MNLDSELYYEGNLAQDRLIFFIPGTVLSPKVYKRVRIPTGYEAIYLSWHKAPGSHSIECVAEKLIRLLEAHRCRHVVLAGHSSGGFIAMQTYLSIQDQSVIKGMLLCDTGCNTIGHANSQTPQEIMAAWNEQALEIFLKKCFAKPVDAETFRQLKEYGMQITPEARIEPWVSQLRLDFTDRLHEIVCPTMVVYGQEDKVRPLSHAQQLVGGIPHAELCAIPKAGHSPMYENPDLYSNALDTVCLKANESPMIK